MGFFIEFFSLCFLDIAVYGGILGLDARDFFLEWCFERVGGLKTDGWDGKNGDGLIFAYLDFCIWTDWEGF